MKHYTFDDIFPLNLRHNGDVWIAKRELHINDPLAPIAIGRTEEEAMARYYFEQIITPLQLEMSLHPKNQA